jgi:hypothetical protein
VINVSASRIQPLLLSVLGRHRGFVEELLGLIEKRPAGSEPRAPGRVAGFDEGLSVLLSQSASAHRITLKTHTRQQGDDAFRRGLALHLDCLCRWPSPFFSKSCVDLSVMSISTHRV